MRDLRKIVALSLILSFSLFPGTHEATYAADCVVSQGTLSGNSRYVVINSGTNCNWTVPAGVSSISYLAVGGGGGGGGGRVSTNAPNLGGGGGGGGGLVLASTINTSGGTSFTINVGTGGNGGAAGVAGTTGGNTSITFSSTTISANGGYGGQGSNGVGDQDNLSGDGGGNPNYLGGANVWDGGGGGAGSASTGFNGSDIGGQGGNGGNGGSGTLNTLLGSSSYYGGGGGGGGTPSANSNEIDGNGGTGGSSVGGNGGGRNGILPTAGSANTGSGGGGGGWRSSSSDALRAGAAGADGKIIFLFSKSAGSINSLSISSNSGADNTYRTGEIISVTIQMSEAVSVTGSPRIPVLGLINRYFIYFSGSGSSAIVFRYTVATSDSATAGIGVTANTLELNSGSLLDTAGISISLTHSAIAVTNNHRVDGIAPTLSGTSSVSVPENTSSSQIIRPSESGTIRFNAVYDRAYFTLDSVTGLLTFSPRDFENPVDGDLNNVYYVNISITDLAGNVSGSYNFFYTVTNVAETAAVGTPSLSAQATKGITVTISVTSDIAGKFTFFSNGKRIAGCLSKGTTGVSPNFTSQCAWKPTTTGLTKIYAAFTPTSNQFLGGTSSILSLIPASRSTRR